MSPPATTRRRVLAGGVISFLSGFAGCSAIGSEDGISSGNWHPDEGSWPLPWYDVRNTSANPTASPPRQEVERTRSVTTGIGIRDVLVADGYVVAYGDGVRVFTQGDDDPLWKADDSALAAAFAPSGLDADSDRILYLATESSAGSDAVVTAVALDESGATERFRTVIEGERIASILPTESALFIGSEGVSMVLLDPTTGERIRELRGRIGAVHDGGLSTTTDGQVRAYESSTGSVFSDGPIGEDWTIGQADLQGRPFHPAIEDERVLVGSLGIPGEHAGHLHGFDAESGDALWEPQSFGWATWTPAVDDTIGYVGGNDPDSGTGGVAAIDLDDGSVEWSRETNWRPIEPVVAGNGTVLVRHDAPAGAAGPGYVEAYDGDTGETLWSLDLDARVAAVRPVGEAIHLGAGETLHTLKAA